MIQMALIAILVLFRVVLMLHHRRAHRWDARWRDHIQVLKTDSPMNLPAVMPFVVTRRKLKRKKALAVTSVVDMNAERAKRRR